MTRAFDSIVIPETPPSKRQEPARHEAYQPVLELHTGRLLQNPLHPDPQDGKHSRVICNGVNTSLDGLEGNASVSGIMDQETSNLFSARLPSWAWAYHVTRRCRSSDMTFEAVEVKDAVDLFQGVGRQFHTRGGETGIELRWLRGAHDYRAHDRQS